jgi:hypothetical protein
MIADQGTLRQSAAPVRQRIVLEVVEPVLAKGFDVPPDRLDDWVRHRGQGKYDYLCGACGLLLAIGVEPGVFQNRVLACHCGALNRE